MLNPSPAICNHLAQGLSGLIRRQLQPDDTLISHDAISDGFSFPFVSNHQEMRPEVQEICGPAKFHLPREAPRKCRQSPDIPK